jgi:hypothetical protein
MALPELHPISEVSRSIGASPEAAYIRAPFRGRVPPSQPKYRKKSPGRNRG